ncbi:hypothetical protein PQX77_019496 [Marasmius sp. AFHP31]|nr:hypothetical protein PQX77_019496 [Marasmius sp. AFHP31]
MFALQFTFVPNYHLPPIQSQKHIFVIDQSGHTQGAHIDQAKRTLAKLTRMLSTERTTFSIFNFGHDQHGIWIRSGHHTHTTLDNTSRQPTSKPWKPIAEVPKSRTHTKSLSPPESRHGNSPTAMLILKDGEDDNIANRIISSVRSLSASHNTRLEIHALGVGSGVIIQMYQDIPRAGNGVWQKTSSSAASGYWLAVEHLLSRTSQSIGDPNSSSSAVNFSAVYTRTVHIPPPPSPPPSSEQSTHAGTRMVIFAIITLKNSNHPKRSRPLDGSPQPLSYELTVPIRGVQLKDSEPRIPILMHILAASQHEKSRAALPSPIDLVPVPPGVR